MSSLRIIAFLLLLIAITGCNYEGASTTAGTAPVPSTTSTTSAGDPDGGPETSTPVALEVVAARAAHTATELPSGELFVAGGCITDGCGVATDETFVVASNGGSAVKGPNLAGPRDGHTATPLDDGRVVIVAGYAGEGQPPLGSVEVFDGASETIQELGSLAQERGGHAAALLPGDRVLVVGGWIARQTYTDLVEIVDVASRSAIPAAPLPIALHAMDAVPLPDGRVLVTGGQVEGGDGTNRAWLYDPSTDSWSETDSMAEQRFKHFSLLLADGTALVIGGTTDDRTILSSTEIYDSASESFAPGPDLVEPRYKLPGGATVLDAENVVVGGGGRTVEIIDLAAWTSTAVEDLGSEGSFATATRLGNGDVLVLGGYDRSIDLRREFRIISSR